MKIAKYIKKKNKKIGLLVAEKDYETGAVAIGWSLCSKNDEFTVKEAFNIAEGRAHKRKCLEEAPLSIRKPLAKFVHRAERYFGKDFMFLANEKKAIGYSIPLSCR